MKHFPVYKLAIILIGALFLVAFQQDLVVAQNVTLSETITSTITFTLQSAQSSTPTARFTTIFSAELTRIIQELLSALLIAFLGSLLTYFLAIRRIRHQLEADIRKETEISRQRLKTDLDKEFLARYNERKWDTYTKFADIVRTMIESSKNQKLQKQFPKIVAELYGFTGDLWIVGGDNVVTAFNKQVPVPSDIKPYGS